MHPFYLSIREESHEERHRGIKIIAFLVAKSILYYGNEKEKSWVTGGARTWRFAGGSLMKRKGIPEFCECPMCRVERLNGESGEVVEKQDPRGDQEEPKGQSQLDPAFAL
jgi:hypothetical protein